MFFMLNNGSYCDCLTMEKVSYSKSMSSNKSHHGLWVYNIDPVNVTQYGKTTLVAHNTWNFEQMLTFQHSLFGHFIQEAN